MSRRSKMRLRIRRLMAVWLFCAPAFFIAALTGQEWALWPLYVLIGMMVGLGWFLLLRILWRSE